jgi:outer membrane protein OmpA-like peptidoglycan-associated protein
MLNQKRHPALLALLAMLALLFLAAVAGAEAYTKRDRMWKGAGIGAAVGAAGAILTGKHQADEILAGAAIGGVVGGAIGAYMDRQQERMAHIPGTSVERMGDDTLLVHFNSDVLFDSGSANLDSEGRSTLEQVADVINDYRKTAVVVQGHTDALGSEETNQALSERRAQSVEDYLIARGVDPGRVTSIGFGENAPVASNAADWGRQKNRRVDVLLKAKSGPLGQGF